MDNRIVIEIRDQYGSEVYYPRNEQAHHLATIAGTTTITPRDLKVAKAMGFIVEVAPRTPRF